MELGYWKSQGLAQSARYLAKCKGAAELGITFKDYDFTEGPQWFGTDKPKMAEKTAFPNLPYLSTSDGKVVTQSGAILRYLGQKAGMTVSCEESLAAEVVSGVADDLFKDFFKVVFGVDNAIFADAAKLEEAHQKFLGVCDQFSTHLERTGKFMAGDKLCWVDFKCLHIFNILLRFSEKLKGKTAIQEYIDNVVAEAGIKEYFEDCNENFLAFPATYVCWGGNVPNKIEAAIKE